MSRSLPCSLIRANKKLEISFDQLSYECLMEYQSYISWRDIDPPHAAEYFSRAKKLLEILEVVVCGSVGGFDKDQRENLDLSKYKPHFARFLWIWNHYTTLKEKKEYQALVDEISKNFLRKKEE